MSSKPVKNLAASVRQRLTNLARNSQRPFQEVLQHYAMERFLYRLSQSKYAEKFILKGALMFTAWGGPASRPTKDIDLLGRTENTIHATMVVMKDICNLTVKPDGLEFDGGSVRGEIIKEDADYSGVRVTFNVTLQTARVAMQIDIGFGDVVTPIATLTTYPTMLEFPSPHLLGYPRETVVAEKLEAMVKLGMLNSRMKDFYDLWRLSMQANFDGPTLVEAIQKTFAQRKTDIPKTITALTPAFGSDRDKQRQWQGFLKKSLLTDAPTTLQVVMNDLSLFLMPAIAAIGKQGELNKQWTASGNWGDL